MIKELKNIIYKVKAIAMVFTEDNCRDSLRLFIQEFSKYIISLLENKFSNNWPKRFRESLSPEQQFRWDLDIENELSPNDLIDFQYLKPFAIKYHWLLKPHFGRKTNNLPTWFDEIYVVRNYIAHFRFHLLTEDEVTKAYIHMKVITQILKMENIKSELEQIMNRKSIGENKVEILESEIDVKNLKPDKNELLQKDIDESLTKEDLPKSSEDYIVNSDETDPVYNLFASFKKKGFPPEDIAKIEKLAKESQTINKKVKELKNEIELEKAFEISRKDDKSDWEKKQIKEEENNLNQFGEQGIIGIKNVLAEKTEPVKDISPKEKKEIPNKELVVKGFENEELLLSAYKADPKSIHLTAEEKEWAKRKTETLRAYEANPESIYITAEEKEWSKGIIAKRKRRLQNEFAEQRKIVKQEALFKPLTKDLTLDFKMIYNLKWIKIKGNKIIINKLFSKLIFDFDKYTISEEFLFGQIRTVNYNQVINKFLKDNDTHYFDLRPFSYLEKQKNTILKLSLSYFEISDFYHMYFEIGNQEKAQQFQKWFYWGLSRKKIINLKLFYHYLTAYICGIDINKTTDCLDTGYRSPEKEIHIQVLIHDLLTEPKEISDLKIKNENQQQQEWNDYLTEKLEQIKKEKIARYKRTEERVNQERKLLRGLIKPITKNINIDFFMIADLNPWVKIEDNKVIMEKTFGEIIFDFDNHTISESNIFKRRRTLNYKEIINKYLSNTPTNNDLEISFSLTDLFHKSKIKFQLDFVIGDKRNNKFSSPFSMIKGYNSSGQKIYLLFCYLLAYMSEININKLVDIEVMRVSTNGMFTKRLKIQDFN